MTWTTFTTELDPDQPARSVDIKAINANITALANADSGAPGIKSSAIQDYPWGAEDFQTGQDEEDWVKDRIKNRGNVPKWRTDSIVPLRIVAGHSAEYSSASTPPAQYGDSASIFASWGAGTVYVDFEHKSNVSSDSVVQIKDQDGNLLFENKTSSTTYVNVSTTVSVSYGDSLIVYIGDDNGNATAFIRNLTWSVRG